MARRSIQVTAITVSIVGSTLRYGSALSTQAWQAPACVGSRHQHADGRRSIRSARHIAQRLDGRIEMSAVPAEQVLQNARLPSLSGAK